MSGESRQELLAWLNDLLQLNYAKIEQVGTGAALCQIFDSIYGTRQPPHAHALTYAPCVHISRRRPAVKSQV